MRLARRIGDLRGVQAGDDLEGPVDLCQRVVRGADLRVGGARDGPSLVGAAAGKEQGRDEEEQGGDAAVHRPIVAGEPRPRLSDVAYNVDSDHAREAETRWRTDMSDLIVVSFESEDEAGAALQALRDLRSAGCVEIADAAVIRKDAGRQDPRQGHARRRGHRRRGRRGGLGPILMVFFPVVGLVVGAIGGAIVGHAVSDHVEKYFVDEVSAKLEAGQSALFVLLGSDNVDGRRRRSPTDRRRDARADEPRSRARGGPQAGR